MTKYQKSSTCYNFSISAIHQFMGMLQEMAEAGGDLSPEEKIKICQDLKTVNENIKIINECFYDSVREREDKLAI